MVRTSRQFWREGRPAKNSGIVPPLRKNKPECFADPTKVDICYFGDYSSTLLKASSSICRDKYSPDLISSSITGLAFGIKPRFLATNMMLSVPRIGIFRSDAHFRPARSSIIASIPDSNRHMKVRTIHLDPVPNPKPFPALGEKERFQARMYF